MPSSLGPTDNRRAAAWSPPKAPRGDDLRALLATANKDGAPLAAWRDLALAAVNVLPALLDVAEAARAVVAAWDADDMSLGWDGTTDLVDALRAALVRLEATE